MSEQLDAVAMLLALVKENPELVSELQSAKSPEALEKVLVKRAAEENEKALRRQAMENIARKCVEGTDVEEFHTSILKFAELVEETVKVKAPGGLTHTTNRWFMTVPVPSGTFKFELIASPE